MLFLSQEAAAELEGMLERAEAQPTEGLRLRKDGEQLVLQLDRPAESDVVVHIGTRVGIIIDRNVEAGIGESLLDVEQGPEGNRLIIGRVPEP